MAGANPNVIVRHSFGHGTPLHAAAKQGLANTVSVLLSSPSTDKNALDNQGFSPLMASERGHAATVKVLLAAGADTDIRDPDDHSALVFAAQHERIDVMKAFLEHGVDANVGEDDWNPLHWAAQFNGAGCIAVLLDAAADIDAKCPFLDGKASLHVAAEAGNNEALLALLRRGASVHQTTDDGSTALHLVSEMEGHAPDDTVDILLRRGVQKKRWIVMGKPPFICSNECSDVFRARGRWGTASGPS
ncbi:unnamed protein product [Ectocarpus sp. 12 AP-2014]